jgi:replication factor C subunit 3/5
MDATSNAHVPWVEKYRPQRLADVVSQDHAVTTLRSFVESGQFPHLLLHGPAGTGKTSSVLAIAQELYGPQWRSQVLELNASDERGIDVVRDQIKTFAGSAQIFSSAPFKLVVLDESDNMTSAAQMALRRVIERYTKNTRFCLICNYVHKILPAIQSRCTKFRFKPLAPELMAASIDRVIAAESVSISPEAKSVLLDLAAGDMRRALNVLQSLATGTAALPGAATSIVETITCADVYAAVGQPDPATIRKLIGSLAADPLRETIDGFLTTAIDSGAAVDDLVECLHLEVLPMALPAAAKATLLLALADAKDNLDHGCKPPMQVAGIAAAFFSVRGMLTA